MEKQRVLAPCPLPPPDVFHASMIMLYDDKVAMISTRQENFGCILQSKEFSLTLRAFSTLCGIWGKAPDAV